MKKIKVCFWLNVQSAHQSLFLDELYNHQYIDLKVCYFDKTNKNRIKLGWSNEENYKDYELKVLSLDTALDNISDWKERIHIVMGYGFSFNKTLVPLLIKEQVKWIHWSERYGIGLAKKLNYNVFLFKLLRPLFLLTKRDYGKLVQKYALGCFAQGELAKKDFLLMGISEQKIENLFYTSELKKNISSEKTNKKNEIIFLYVGQLSERKGTKDLLLAFKNLQVKNVKLYLVGQDTSDGKYLLLVKKLRISRSVVFKGIVPFNKIHDIYDKSDVFVFPSRYDGWGAVLNEAAYAGLPIIATNQTGAAYHIIENNFNGYRYEASDIEALVSKMQYYVNNKQFIDIHGKNSKEVIKKFTPKVNVGRFINALKKWGVDF